MLGASSNQRRGRDILRHHISAAWLGRDGGDGGDPITNSSRCLPHTVHVFTRPSGPTRHASGRAKERGVALERRPSGSKVQGSRAVLPLFSNRWSTWTTFPN